MLQRYKIILTPTNFQRFISPLFLMVIIYVIQFQFAKI